MMHVYVLLLKYQRGELHLGAKGANFWIGGRGPLELPLLSSIYVLT